MSVFLWVGLVSCGSSAATPAPNSAAGFMPCGGSATTTSPSSTSTLGNWHVVLTAQTRAVGLGITGLALDGRGNVYLAEFDDSRIYKYSTSGRCLARLGEPGSGQGQLEAPDKLAFDAQGNLYVTEVGSLSAGPGQNSRVQKFSATGMSLARWGTFGSSPGQFNTPVGIGVDKQGDIYVADVGNHRIQKLSPLGQSLTQWHTVGSGTGALTEIGYDLALDSSGNVYLSEPHPFSAGNDRIQKFSRAGTLLATWGGSGSGPGQFINPTGLAVDAEGNIYVVDSGNNRVEELSPTGQFMGQWEGPGFKFVSKIAVDGLGNMFVSVGSQVLVRQAAP